MLAGVVIGSQRERRDLAGAMARLALCLDDRGPRLTRRSPVPTSTGVSLSFCVANRDPLRLTVDGFAPGGGASRGLDAIEQASGAAVAEVCMGRLSKQRVKGIA